MAQSYTAFGQTLYVPGAYSRFEVKATETPLPVAGVVAVVGEAERGPSLSAVRVTADTISILSQFGSGRLYDAAKAALSAASGVGGAQEVVCVKTNTGGVAKATIGSPAWATFGAGAAGIESAGEWGNQITVKPTYNGGPGSLTLEFNLSTSTSSQSRSITVDGTSVAPLKFMDTPVTSLVITSTLVTVNGIPFTKASYPTVATLANAINAQITGAVQIQWASGYATQPPSILDPQNEPTVSSDFYATADIFDLAQKIQDVPFVAISTAPTTSILGSSFTLTAVPFSTGSLGGTTDANIQSALDLLKPLTVNFVVPLFSQDASDDYAEGLTDTSSTYAIANIHVAALTHVEERSQFKIGRNRQAILSITGASYSAIKETALNLPATVYAPQLAHFRGAMAFQGALVSIDGATGTFQPWMTAVLAAGAQSALAYQPLFNKPLVMVGIVNPSGFGADQLEDAVRSNLLPLTQRDSDNAFTFATDQTAYGLDNNFVYNSIQAVYGADYISRILRNTGQRFVGQSVADAAAAVVKSAFQTTLSQLLTDKWISTSSDAPAGYRNLVINLRAPVLAVSVEVKESTGIYFVPINFSLSAVQQSA